MHKKMKVVVSSIVAASAFVTTTTSQQGVAAANLEQLLVDAQNASNVLKWAISVEGSADGVTQPWGPFNNAKLAIAKVEAALNDVSFSEKLKYESRLIDSKVQIQRAQGYLDAITASAKIRTKTQSLSSAIYTNNLDQVEKAYHEMTTEYRKQAILLDRVYGQSTRNRIRDAVKGPAEKLISDLKNDITVHMLAKSAEAEVRRGNYTEAVKKVQEAQAILQVNVLVWEESLQWRIDNINTSLPLQVVSSSRANNTTFSITLNRAISNIKASEITFDNGLTVTNASLSKDGRTITLTTSVQLPGTTYTLKYKTINASFTVPGSIVPIYVGDRTVQHNETSDVIALAAIFNESNGATVRIDIPAGLKVISVNGVANNTVGEKSVQATTDRNGSVTLVFTTKDQNTAAMDKVISFNKLVKNKVVETQTSSAFNFYTVGKAGSFSNKKLHYVDIYNNFFVTTDGTKYRLKPEDTYQNEGSYVSFDSFKSSLDIGDVVNGSYHPTSTSAFNISTNLYVSPVILDSKFTYKPGSNGYRMDGNKIELFGTGQPNYELFFYKNNGIAVGKTKVKSNGSWVFTAEVDQQAVTDFSILQQVAGKAIPAYAGWGEMALRVIEGPFELESISGGMSDDDDLEDETITFSIAPIYHSNGTILAQDQVGLSKQASIIVMDSDGTKVKYTNNQNQTYFSKEQDAFTITFGSINSKKSTGSLLNKGKDGKLSGTLQITSVEGVTNDYGLPLTINKRDQIKGY